MHGHIYVGILQEKAGAQDPEKPAPQTLRGPAQSKCMWMHVDILQKQFFARIYGKNASVQRAYPDLTLAETLTVRTPQCGHAVWGKSSKLRNKECSNVCTVEG